MKILIQNRTIPMLLVACVSLLALPAMADGLTAQQIVDKSLERNKFGFQNAIADITLKLISKRGSERVREVQIKSIEREGLGKSLVRFHAPADVAGTGFLLLEKADADDDQYLYLPALGKVKRITGSQRNQRFMGTDLTYADMESRDLKNSSVTTSCMPSSPPRIALIAQENVKAPRMSSVPTDCFAQTRFAASCVFEQIVARSTCCGKRTSPSSKSTATSLKDSTCLA